MNVGNALGLYVHIPFCRSKCAYCDFYSLSGAESLMDAYLDALCVQLEASAPLAVDFVVDSVYFGGGTPSYLGAARLLRLLNKIRRHYRIAPDAEITLEANPDSVGAQFADLRGAGFNRVSLGMQSASDSELRAVGRVHASAQTRQAVETIRRAGFDNLSLDLIYGLPEQSRSSWRESVARAMALSPEHLSCYGLKVEKGTPLFSRRAQLPDDDAQADCYLWAVEALREAGYAQYEVSNFAKSGRESRHNLKYWTLQPYLGFGPGAHSDFGGERWAIARDLRGFIAASETRTRNGAGLSSDVRGELARTWTRSESTVITERERARERLMLGLRTAQGLDLSECAALFGRNFGALDAFFGQCASAGYASATLERVALTPQGFLVSNQIIGRVLDLFDRA